MSTHAAGKDSIYVVLKRTGIYAMASGLLALPLLLALGVGLARFGLMWSSK